jgi:hypothetical protein
MNKETMVDPEVVRATIISSGTVWTVADLLVKSP